MFHQPSFFTAQLTQWVWNMYRQDVKLSKAAKYFVILILGRTCRFWRPGG